MWLSSRTRARHTCLWARHASQPSVVRGRAGEAMALRLFVTENKAPGSLDSVYSTWSPEPPSSLIQGHHAHCRGLHRVCRVPDLPTTDAHVPAPSQTFWVTLGKSLSLSQFPSLKGATGESFTVDYCPRQGARCLLTLLPLSLCFIQFPLGWPSHQVQQHRSCCRQTARHPTSAGGIYTL